MMAKLACFYTTCHDEETISYKTHSSVSTEYSLKFHCDFLPFAMFHWELLCIQVVIQVLGGNINSVAD